MSNKRWDWYGSSRSVSYLSGFIVTYIKDAAEWSGKKRCAWRGQKGQN